MIKLSFCQNDPLLEELFWQKDTLITHKNLEEKDGQTRVRQSVSARVVACLAVITLIKDCNKILKSHGKQIFFSHYRDLLVH